MTEDYLHDDIVGNDGLPKDWYLMVLKSQYQQERRHVIAEIREYTMHIGLFT